MVSNIENETQQTGAGSQTGGSDSTGTQTGQDDTGKGKSREELEAKLAEAEKALEEKEKAVKGFQPALDRSQVERKKLETKVEELESQVASQGQGEKGTEEILQKRLLKARTALFQARAKAKAMEIIATSKLPDTMKKRIADNPLAHIHVPDDATEGDIEFEVEDQLPSYLTSLEKDLGISDQKTGGDTGGGDTGENKQVVGTPLPSGQVTGGGKTIYADEIDPKTPGGYEKFKELQADIDAGKITVLPSRKK